ncbi:MAG: STAS domain-containing protein [Phycisphaerales bacterium]
MLPKDSLEEPAGQNDAGLPQFVRTQLKKDGVLIVMPVGPTVGQREAPIITDDVKKQLDAAGDAVKTMVLDLTDVSMMSSMGLGMCIDLRNILVRNKATVILTGMKPEIAGLFRMMKIERLFTVASTREQLRKLLA